MRVAILGPTWPYTGGVTHYNVLLGNSLQKNNHVVKAFSYKLLCPERIHPGDSLIDKTQQDKAEFDYINLINILNPLNWLKVIRKVKEFNPDIIITHLWIPLILPAHRFILSKIKAKKICICHNIAPHEKIFFNKILIRRFLKQFDYFIVHGESQKEQLLKFSSKINSQNVAVTTIPTFINHFNAEKLTTKEAREKLDIQGKILLFFGFVRPYKGLSNLIYSLPIINEKYDDVILLIAGEFWWNQRKIIDNIIDELQLRNIQIVDQYIPDEEVGIYFQAADVVILPYNTGSGSGVIQTAFSYSKPVIATDVGTFSEIIKDKKIGLIIPPKNPPAIADAVIYLYEEMDRKELEKNIAKELHHFSWEKLVDVFDNFMKNNSN